MRLRPYQIEAVEAVIEQFQTEDSTLLVQATGTGKTVVFAHVTDQWESGRVMVIAHREELIDQAIKSIELVTGHAPDKEMAGCFADTNLFMKTNVVVSSVQTQSRGRMKRFNPNDFGLLIIDEAHHATAPTYRELIDYYKQNSKLRVLGVTATPDRADEAALGKVFGSVAHVYDVIDAVNDGWLVPIRQTRIAISDLDYSGIRTTAGDLNGADLELVLTREKMLHCVADPIMQLARDKQTLVFATTVHHAELLAEIFNRHEPGCAAHVSGKTPREERREIISQFANRSISKLVNVGVFTEGFDVPGIEVVAMARPTKSRALYCQMLGRGTRPLPGIVDAFSSCGEMAHDFRKEAIAASSKPFLHVIDFAGNSGHHKLVTSADILGGNETDKVVDRANEIIESKGCDVDVLEEIATAKEEIDKEREEERLRAVAKRSKLIVRTRFERTAVDPFDVFELQPQRERGWDVGRELSPKMATLLQKQGIDISSINYTQAKQIIGELFHRWDTDKCTYKQAKLIGRYGYSPDTTRSEASVLIDAIKRAGWKRPEEQTA